MLSQNSVNSAWFQALRSIQLLVRRLADGDKGGYMRRGLDAFPFPDMAKRIWQEYFVPGGKPSGTPYPATPMHQRNEPAQAD